MRDLTAEQLENLYRKTTECKPSIIAFSINDINQAEKAKHLLKVAREMAK